MNKKQTIINPAFTSLSSFVELIKQAFDQSGELIYSGRNQLKRFEVDGEALVVKSFRIPILLNRIAYTFLRSSKAQRSYENSIRLSQLGVATPAPIAYVCEYHNGLLLRSYYLCREEQACRKAEWFFYNEQDNELFYCQLAEFVADVQQAGVWHEDLSPGNILVREQGEEYTFSIVDTNRMKFCSISDKKRLQNFIRLFPRRKGSTMFARYYARYRELDEELTVVRINAICDHFFGRKVVRWSKAKVRKTEGWWHSICGPIQHYQLLRFVRRLLQLPESSSITQKERKLYDSYIVGSDPRELFKP